MHTIPFTTITRDDRTRQDYGEVPELAESLYTHGFIHPICINHSADLIAGGRRSAALDHLFTHATDFPPDKAHPSMVSLLSTGNLEFGIHYTLRPTDTIDELSELELIENIQRKNFSWQEEVLAVEKIHKLKLRAQALGQLPDGQTWGQKQTGRLLGVAQTNVSYCLRLAERLKDPDSPLWKCSGIFEALQRLIQERTDEASKRLADEIKTRASSVPTVTIPTTNANDAILGFVQAHNPTLYQSGDGIGLDLDEFGDSPATPSPITAEQSEANLANDNLQEAAEVVTKFVHNLDCVDFLEKLGPKSVDHIICDPPYAIDMTMLKQGGGQGQKDIERIAHTHDVDDNLGNFEPWLKACFDAVNDRGFVIWFCDGFHFRTLYDLATKIGFKVSRWPFHWVKTTPCINQAAAYNFTKAVEHAIVMRKKDARLVAAQSTNYWVGGLTVEDKAALPHHPFIKPLGLWQHLARAVALPGASIVDPFSGVGSSTRAFLLGGWQPIAGELDKVHYASQVHNVMEAYKKLKQ